jgi:hypothetical protein
MYDYKFNLPAPFRAIAGKKYWLQIAAAQKGIPDWGIAEGTGGDGSHVRRSAGTHGYTAAVGDVAYILLTPESAAPVAPPATSNSFVAGGQSFSITSSPSQ